MARLIEFGGTTPQVDEQAFVADNATLVGAVTVGADSSIWFGTVLRADVSTITVGVGTSIQDNSVVHCDAGFPAVIGDHVTVGHRAIVHGARIEDHVIVGMGAVVLNGAQVGAWSIVGAGAVIREGQVIPPGSLVGGVPGKVIKELDEATRERVRVNADHYVELGAAYRRMQSTGD